MNWTLLCEISGSCSVVAVMISPFWGAVLWWLMIRYQNLEECSAYSSKCNVGENVTLDAACFSEMLVPDK